MIDPKFYSKDLINPPYPPYHEGKDLEDFFIDFYFSHKEEFDNTGYEFIPVKWTAIYNIHGYLSDPLQDELNSLDKNKKYFTVSQHDDAPHHQLPSNTINFSAGGNIPNTVPIPLICSKIKNKPENLKRDIFCSFVGSVCQNFGGISELAHKLRMHMLEVLINDSKYILKPKHWSPNIKEDRQKLFLDITSKSKFCLCPRGYGATSFRLYEAMQLGSIPVYIYHKEPFLPFKDKLDWDNLTVMVEYSEVHKIDSILNSISEEKYQQMLKYTSEIYCDYFSLKGMSTNILQLLK
jgi:hypothetical protein